MIRDSIESQREMKRYRVCNDRLIQASLRVKDAGSTPASIVDISSVGARLSVKVPLMAMAEVDFEFQCKQLGLECSADAVVRWCTPRSDGWQIGVSFADELLTDEVLDKLANNGILERRQSSRLPMVTTGKLKRSGEAAATPIEVIDVSSDGICIISPNDATVGDSLLLSLDTPQSNSFSVVAVTRWVEQLDDGYRLGCEIPSTQLQPMLNACGLGMAESKPRASKTRYFSKITWIVATLCAAATLTMAYLPPKERSEYLSHAFSECQRMYNVAADWTVDTTTEIRNSLDE